MVEPRVVVKIPLAPKVRGADTGKFLQEPTLYTRSLACAFFKVGQKSARTKYAALKSLVTKKA